MATLKSKDGCLRAIYNASPDLFDAYPVFPEALWEGQLCWKRTARPLEFFRRAEVGVFMLSAWTSHSRPRIGRQLLAGSTRSLWLPKAVNHWQEQTNQRLLSGA